jgi:hypothetical protein
MNFVKGLWKYIIIVIIGILLAFFVRWIQYDTSDLSASVLSITEQDFFESTKWDAWYKKEKQIFEVFITEQTRNEWELTISIIYSPENIERFTDKLNTNYSVNLTQQDEWNLILNVNWYEKWDFSEWLFELPYSWNSKDITLEYIKSKNLDFAIWNLDNIEDNQTH